LPKRGAAMIRAVRGAAQALYEVVDKTIARRAAVLFRVLQTSCSACPGADIRRQAAVSMM